ncbi:MAG: T9SS type A sorting domain-containing protein [Moheibacter sp.]
MEVEDIPFFAIEDGSIVFSDINGDQIPDFILTGSYNFSLYTKVYINNSDQMKINDWNKNNLSIYPNPVKNILNIDSDDTILGVKIYNMTGQELKNVKTDSKNAKIDMEGIHSGVYIFKVQTSK